MFKFPSFRRKQKCVDLDEIRYFGFFEIVALRNRQAQSLVLKPIHGCGLWFFARGSTVCQSY